MDRSPRRFTRSAQMVSCLKEHVLYSEKRARDLLFDAIGDIVVQENAAAGPPMVSRLVREAANRAKLAAQQSAYEFKSWETTGKAVVNAMLGAGVLLDADLQPIPFGITSQATEVTAIAEDFRDLTEAFLLDFLIRKLGDVSTRDHTALAHALFRQFDPGIPMGDMEDRVVLLLARLADRIVLTPEGSYRDVGDWDPAIF